LFRALPPAALGTKYHLTCFSTPHQGATGTSRGLRRCSKNIDETPRGRTCDAIVGIIEEGQEVMKEFKGAPALDGGLLAAAQVVEHYEIARYGTLKTWAADLGLNQAKVIPTA
jgi:ferritin-like metal-binding protein YciE